VLKRISDRFAWNPSTIPITCFLYLTVELITGWNTIIASPEIRANFRGQDKLYAIPDNTIIRIPINVTPSNSISKLPILLWNLSLHLCSSAVSSEYRSKTDEMHFRSHTTGAGYNTVIWDLLTWATQPKPCCLLHIFTLSTNLSLDVNDFRFSWGKRKRVN